MKKKTKTQWVVVRSGQSGVWFGRLVSLNDDSCVLNEARKIWSWEGALTTSHIAVSGVSSIDSRVTAPADGVWVGGVCEVIPASDFAAAVMDEVKPW